jgi:hypothetical protein
MFGTPNATIRPREPEDKPEDKPKDPAPKPPTKALNIILENKRRGVPMDEDFQDTMNWKLYSVTSGTESRCQNNPGLELPADVSIATFSTDALRDAQSPHGTYDIKTQDGDCQYKNDGKGNAGAVWCGDQGHVCKEHPG